MKKKNTKSAAKKKAIPKKKAASKKKAIPKKKSVPKKKAARAPRLTGTCSVICHVCGQTIGSGLSETGAASLRTSHRAQFNHQDISINCSQ